MPLRPDAPEHLHDKPRPRRRLPMKPCAARIFTKTVTNELAPDTSVLIGTIHAGDPRQAIALNALAILIERGEDLFVVPQNLVEFWAVATRPFTANGLGLSA